MITHIAIICDPDTLRISLTSKLWFKQLKPSKQHNPTVTLCLILYQLQLKFVASSRDYDNYFIL